MLYFAQKMQDVAALVLAFRWAAMGIGESARWVS
jgi:hypothetical protein